MMVFNVAFHCITKVSPSRVDPKIALAMCKFFWIQNKKITGNYLEEQRF